MYISMTYIWTLNIYVEVCVCERENERMLYLKEKISVRSCPFYFLDLQLFPMETASCLGSQGLAFSFSSVTEYMLTFKDSNYPKGSIHYLLCILWASAVIPDSDW